MLLRYKSFFAADHDYAPVLQGLQRLEPLKGAIAPQLQGKILAVKAKVAAFRAQDRHDFAAALRLIDQAENLVGQGTGMPGDLAYLAALDEERYHLDRAEVLMLSPRKTFRSPHQAQEYLDRSIQRGNSHFKRLHTDRQIDINLFQARIYLDQEYYPIAATAAETAVVSMLHLQSRNRLKDAVYLLEQLTERYPQGLEVAHLELELLKLQQPHLFT